MTFDKFLSTFLDTLIRIAVAIEAIVESQGIVAGTRAPAPHEDQGELALDDDDLGDDDLGDDDLGDDDLGDDDLDDDPPVTKKKSKKKSVGKKKKKGAKKKSVGKKTAEATSDFTSDEVRGFLKEVQICTGSAAEAKSILKKNGASTFGQLQIGRYNETVAACKLITDEYE